MPDPLYAPRLSSYARTILLALCRHTDLAADLVDTSTPRSTEASLRAIRDLRRQGLIEFDTRGYTTAHCDRILARLKQWVEAGVGSDGLRLKATGKYRLTAAGRARILRTARRANPGYLDLR